jgi:formate hydrogenlyase subunit 6/NADH:ubiquinone oxidoreductase subunit I
MSFPKALQDELRATVVDSSRRSFVGLSAGGLAGLGAGGAPADLDACTGANAPGAVPAGRRTPVVAPGARGIDHLRSACIACQLCVSSCPTRVLQPSLLELGGRSFLQPHLDFRIAFCDYECTRCGDVCPTQAIAGLTAKVKKRTKIGEVRLVEEYCIAVAGEKTCAACAEYCPTRAVRMAPNKDGGIRPKLDTPVCIGCGACEYACPAQPQKAIFVEGAQEHRKARPPRNFPMHHYRHPDGFPF